MQTDFTRLTPHLDDPQRRAQLRRIEADLREHPFPPQLVVENTSHCNLRCAHCAHKSLQRPKQHMDATLWRRIVEEVGQCAPECELWPTFYGEALLLREELWQRLDYAHQVGCRNLVLNTNGALLDRWDAIDRILDSPLKRLIVSLDGLSPQSFETIRAGAKHAGVYAAVETLCRRRQERGLRYPAIIAQFSVMRENAHEAQAFQDYWRARRAEVKIRPMLEWGGAVRAETIRHDADFRCACPWGNNTMAILQDGRVSACAVDYEGRFSVGRIGQITLQEAWRRLGERLRAPQRAHRWDALPAICQGCGDWQTAGAQYDPQTLAGTRPFWSDAAGDAPPTQEAPHA
ncbi:radical SAM/SPASM domain-containing protein [Magnetofaba australis]|uniref:radical SAM/SPASM domain-containing protein n=1 Tax=Magnetofaba australis TaxID=1472297 RepID=UPI000A19E5C9|nr:radical SAM protein [Magnetofaba australis]